MAALAMSLPTGGLSADPALHAALRALLAGALDVPLGGTQQSAVEAAVAEEYARALSPASHNAAGKQHSTIQMHPPDLCQRPGARPPILGRPPVTSQPALLTNAHGQWTEVISGSKATDDD